MGDLMAGIYTYSALAKKYKDFHTPAFKIKIGGNDVVSLLKLAVENLTVDLSMEASSTCTFTIVNAYDTKTRAFNKTVTSKLVLGAVVEVELGYLSSMTMVFKGYISNVGVEFNGAPTMSITAMDVRRLMMEGKERSVKHDVRNYSDAFMEVMRRYSKITPYPQVDKTDENLESVSQASSDYDFVCALARASKREFFVLAGRAYFRIPQKATQPIITLEWGKDLLSFSRNSLYQVLDIKVIGFNDGNKAPVIGQHRGKSDGTIKEVISQTQPTVIQDPLATDIKKAKKRAEAEAEERRKKSQSGSGSCIGLPEVVPGRFITLKKLDPAIDGNYYINGVTHTLGTDGFTTTFNIGGWK